MSKDKSRSLNFREVKRASLTLHMLDEAETKIRVAPAPVELIEELQELAPELEVILQQKDRTGVDEAYNLAARLISCNRDCLTVTGEELRKKYGIDFELLIVFFSDYMDFVQEFYDAKN